MKAARAGIDTAGGLITGGTQLFVFIQGAPWVVVGDPVADHALPDLHTGVTMAPPGQPQITIAGAAVCIETSPATCGHVATGSGHVEVL